MFDYPDAHDVLADARRREAALAGSVDPIDPAFDHCRGDGHFRHPLLAGTEWAGSVRSVAISGEGRDGRGYHPMATFSWSPMPDRPSIEPSSSYEPIRRPGHYRPEPTK